MSSTTAVDFSRGRGRQNCKRYFRKLRSNLERKRAIDDEAIQKLAQIEVKN